MCVPAYEMLEVIIILIIIVAAAAVACVVVVVVVVKSVTYSTIINLVQVECIFN